MKKLSLLICLVLLTFAAPAIAGDGWSWEDGTWGSQMDSGGSLFDDEDDYDSPFDSGRSSDSLFSDRVLKEDRVKTIKPHDPYQLENSWGTKQPSYDRGSIGSSITRQLETVR